uniref:p8 n=1 Tax=Helicoverpa armigera stunt virus TaxID=37206 RepID=A0A1V0JZQ2_HASV|nr:p8 [Helicoverpa armigera stunt virus]
MLTIHLFSCPECGYQARDCQTVRVCPRRCRDGALMYSRAVGFICRQCRLEAHTLYLGLCSRCKDQQERMKEQN